MQLSLSCRERLEVQNALSDSTQRIGQLEEQVEVLGKKIKVDAETARARVEEVERERDGALGEKVKRLAFTSVSSYMYSV